MNCVFNDKDFCCSQCGFVASSAGANRNCPASPRYAEILESFRSPARSTEWINKFVASGPGSELHALLGRFGLTASGDCKCRSRAELMNANGCDWCEANIEEIVGWLRESAAERGLPFVDVAGKLLVRRAIANARRKEQARAREAQAEGGATAG